MEVPDTPAGLRAANREAQRQANRAGRKVYLQLDRNFHRDGFHVLVGTDGRGPIHLGSPWTEVWPETVTVS